MCPLGWLAVVLDKQFFYTMHMPDHPLVADTLRYSFVAGYFQMSRNIISTEKESTKKNLKMCF